MKKGTIVKVSYDSDYNGRDMDWTETFTGFKKIGVGGEWVTHSSTRMVKNFYPKEICVHPFNYSASYFESTAKRKDILNVYHWSNFIYAIYLPEGFTVKTFSDDEYRFDIDTNTKIIYCGEVIEAHGIPSISKNTGRPVHTYIQYSNTLKPWLDKSGLGALQSAGKLALLKGEKREKVVKLIADYIVQKQIR